MSRKKLFLFLIPLLMLACKALFPEPAARQQPTIAPTHPALKTSTPRLASSTAEANAPIQKGFTLVRLEPDEGNLPDLLAAEAQKAAALEQMPVVEFDAPW
jgi:hypothetical protein